MFDDDDDERRREYAKLLRRPEWRARRAEILAERPPRCQRCKRKNGPLSVHHIDYDFGVKPWDYSDDDLEVLCRGCHRKADREREERRREIENRARYENSWQYDEGKRCQAPTGKALCDFEKHRVEFTIWLTRERILQDSWDWNVFPLSFLWNQFSGDFLSQRQEGDPQGQFEF